MEKPVPKELASDGSESNMCSKPRLESPLVFSAEGSFFFRLSFINFAVTGGGALFEVEVVIVTEGSCVIPLHDAIGSYDAQKSERPNAVEAIKSCGDHKGPSDTTSSVSFVRTVQFSLYGNIFSLIHQEGALRGYPANSKVLIMTW
ncbi:hypothetical protein AMTR_s00065p00126390 [Amborella trichopoda]|uniref:Uncharacterized protein n=1 Tax=Amborella trichopoda TaxID=13333 RepID=U5D7Z3_AMBTC|nr:hypothetical protein AMTR_s00065p00126390 [Amborella trichopoda]